ncbi:MAG: type IX secretion system membrane protein PorP/SprF [Cytophagales bacterium]|nr:MAG: type IX secretion system membrane protein PorP/SprF [Cytophagales bacterium]
MAQIAYLSKKLGILFILYSLISNTFAQNAWYSQFGYTPMQTNPAMVATSNQFQFIFNYRNQFISSGTSFNTPMATFTMPIINSQKGHRLGGIGISAINDMAGENGLLQTTGIQGGAAFNIPLNLPLGLPVLYDGFLSLGGQVGYFQKGFDINKITTSSQFVNGFYIPGSSSGESFASTQTNYISANAGAFWYVQDTTEVPIVYMGISVYNLNQPNTAFDRGVSYEDKLPITFSATAGLDVYSGIRLAIQPNMRWIGNKNTNIFNFGILTRYHFGAMSMNNLVRDTNLNIGLWYSTSSGMIAAIGLQQARYFLNVSYDMGTLTNKNIPAGSGAIEVSLGIKFGKKRIFKGKEPILSLDSILVQEVDTITTVVQDTNQQNKLPKDLSIFDYHAHFYFMSDTINKASIELLDNMATLMTDYPEIKIKVSGHTCNIAKSDMINNELSLKRAESVKKYLINKGITPERIQTAGYGSTKPIASNETEFGRIKNRRVEFEVISPQNK